MVSTLPHEERGMANKRVRRYWLRIWFLMAFACLVRLVVSGGLTFSVAMMAQQRLNSQDAGRIERMENELKSINTKIADQEKNLYGTNIQLGIMADTMKEFRGEVTGTRNYVQGEISSVKTWGLSFAAGIISLLFWNVLTLKAAVKKRTDTDSVVVDLNQKIVEALEHIKKHGDS